MSAPNVHIAIKGGLGNQMFQAALGIALSRHIGANIHYIFSYFNIDAYNRKPLLGFFPNLKWIQSADPEKIRKMKVFQENSGTNLEDIAEYVENNGDIIIDGYWQNEKFFSLYRDDVIGAFAIPEESGVKSSISGMNAGNLIAIHVRRSDYGHHGLAKFSYYSSCIEAIRKSRGNIPGVIFTDEQNYCKSMFAGIGNLYIAGKSDTSTPIGDFYTMSLCRDFVIANSSFSWWAAWLGEKSDSLIYAPDPWSTASPMVSQTAARSVVPSRWTVVENAVQSQ